MKTKLTKHKALALLLSIVMLFSVMSPMTAFAVSFDKTKLASDTYLTSKTDYTVAPGITESHITTNNSTGSNQVRGFALEVDLSEPTTSIITSYKDYDATSWGMQKVRDQAYAAEKKLGVNVVAGINGDFYNMSNGAPTGTFIMNGTVYNTNNKWNYFAIKYDGSAVIGSGALDTSDIKECIGGPCVLVKDGEITDEAKKSGYGVDQLPRTAIGITADGSVVMFVADGRQAPTSCGQTFTQLAQAMLALGCVDALSLDGGGSSTLISQHEGSDELVCRNSPSDGSERTVSSALLVCSSATPSGVFDHATLEPNNEVYTPNSTVQLTAVGVDSASAVAELPEDGTFALADDSFGTIDENGLFTSNGKTGTVTVNYVSGGAVVGSTSIDIQAPDSISFTNEEISLGFEKETNLGLTVKYEGRDVNYKDGDIVWTMDDEKMGSFMGNIFTSSDSESITGKIYAASLYDSSVSGSITAIIGKLPSIIWDFEEPEKYVFADAVCEASGGTVKEYSDEYIAGVTTMLNINYGRGSLVDSEVIDTDSGEVRMGSYALKLSFDFTGVGKVTEGACVGGVNATESTEGTPTAVGLWMYAPEGTPNYWVRMRFRDGNGTVQTVNFNESGKSKGIDWTGWKYLEADLTSFQAPFSFIAGETIRLMALANSNGEYTYTGVDESGEKTFKYLEPADRKGYVYIDNVQFVYGANTDDVDNPVIDTVQVGSSAGDNMTNIGTATVIDTNDISIETTFHDVENKYMTDINFDACRIYIDGKDVTDKAAVLKGDYTIKYYATLANGTHSVKVTIRDNFNNVTTDTRYFTVNGKDNLPTVSVSPVSDNAVLNSEFTIGVFSNKASAVEQIKANIRFDTDIVKTKDSITVSFADGFNGSYSYNESTGILNLVLSKQTADVEDTDAALARISLKIPSDVAQGKAFVYRVLDGTIDFSDDSIVTDTFASSDISSIVSGSYTIGADTVIVGSPAVFTVTDNNGSAAAGVDVYNKANGEKIGTTDENGKIEYNGFSGSVVNFSVYAMKDGSYSFAYSAQSVSPAGNESGSPEYIIMNASADGNTEKNITWLSHPLNSDAKSVIRYATKADYDKNGDDSLITVTGTNKIYAFLGNSDITKNYASRINAVTIDNLKENTEYVYFVGDGSKWSEMKSFKTGIAHSDTSFFVFGDIQAEDTSNISNMLAAVASDGVEYSFGIQTGDSVEVATQYNCWSDILSVFADDNVSDIDLIHVLGNHEYMGDPDGEAAEAIYNLPDEKFYSVEYGNVYVAVINFRGNTTEEKQEALEWLKSDAVKSDAIWKIVTLHTPPYNTNILDPQDWLRENLTKVCEEVGIDFVFSGHDHSYSRTSPMTNGVVDENGIVYFICGSSGEKSYGITNTPEFNFEVATGDYTAVYISVTATDTEMSIKAYNVTDSGKNLLDEYTKHNTSSCMTDGHSYVYSDGYLACSECGYKRAVGDYTGFAKSADGGKMYFIEGNMQTGWIVVGEDNYLFDENGIAQTGKVTYNGYTYTFGDDGVMTRGDLVMKTKENGGHRYSYYINGEAQRGWFLIDDYWYYFDRQATDFKSVNKANVDIEGRGLVYSFDSESRLIKGAWFTNEYGTSYYWGPDPVMGQLARIDGYTYYFDSDTHMVVNDSVEIDGTTYSFDAEGKFMHYGAHEFDENGECKLCKAHTSPFWNILSKLIALVEKIAKFFTRLFG